MTQDLVPARPRWKSAVALAILCFYILLAVFKSTSAPTKSAMLPSKLNEFLIFTTLELAVFAFFWLVAWSFSRADKDELLLRWRGGLRPIGEGLLYSIGLRLGMMVVVIVALIAAVPIIMLLGIEAEQIQKWMKNLSPSPDRVINPAALSADPVYHFVLLTWGSFVVAGLREELWRAAMLAAGTHLLQPALSARGAMIASLIFSSLIFGIGHLYQGVFAVGLTGLIGVMLGAIMLKHRSIWPAVIAHGAFDALTFLLLPLAKEMSKHQGISWAWF